MQAASPSASRSPETSSGATKLCQQDSPNTLITLNSPVPMPGGERPTVRVQNCQKSSGLDLGFFLVVIHSGFPGWDKQHEETHLHQYTCYFRKFGGHRFDDLAVPRRYIP